MRQRRSHFGGGRLGRAVLLTVVGGAVLATPGPPHSAARAQAVPDFDPSRIERRLRPPTLPGPEPEMVIPEVDRDEPLPEAGGGTLTLRRVILEGATAYDADALAFAYEGQIGSQLTLRQLHEIALRITRRYRGDGFLLSRAILPAQRVEEGVVTVQVLEGYVDRVEIDGTAPGGYPVLNWYVDSLVGERPLSTAVLERNLLLINDLPGVRARAVFVPSPDTPGASTMVLKIEETRFEADISFDNRGSELVGPHQLGLSATANALLDAREALDVQFVLADGAADLFENNRRELAYARGRLRQPVGRSGTSVLLSAAYSRSRPGGSLEPFDVVGQVFTAEARLRHPLKRSRDENLSLGVGFTWRDVKTDVANELQITKDKLRLLDATLTYDRVDSWHGVTLAEVSLRQGLPVLGATGDDDPQKSRVGGVSDSTTLLVSASRFQQVMAGVNLVFGAQAQYALTGTLSPEEYGFGGDPYGRAYDASEITGDHGVGAFAELQYAPDFLRAGRVAATLFGYADIGKTWDRQTGTPEERPAASIGGGVKFDLGQTWFGSVEVAKPLTRPVATQSDGYAPRVFFRARVAF